VGLAGAALVALVIARRKPTLASLAAAVTVPLATALLYYYWLNFIHGVPWVQGVVKVAGARSFLASPDAGARIVSRALVSLPYLGLWASPLIAGRVVTLAGGGWRPFSRETVAALVGMAVFTGAIAFAVSKYAVGLPYLINVINWNGIGTLPLLGIKPSVYPAWVNPLAHWLGLGCGGVLAWLGARAMWGLLRGPRDAALAVALIGSVVAGGGYFLLQDFYDRYLLALTPLAIVLAARSGPISRAGHAAAGLVCAALALYSLVGLADHLAWNAARWTAGRALMAEGVPASEIDGGYEWIGWHEFETAPPPPPLPPSGEPPLDFDKHYWMLLNPKSYWLAFTPLPGYSVHASVPYGNAGGRIYVLFKPDG
jgi:hypothetical protein